MEVTLSIIISSAIAVAGWFVVNYQNRRLRREEAKRDVYYRLFNEVNSMIDGATNYIVLVNEKSREIEDALKHAQVESDSNQKKKYVEKWGDGIKVIIDESFMFSTKIVTLMRTFNLGGTSYGDGSIVFDSLSSIVFDTNQSIRKIADRWINYINFDNMKEKQYSEIMKETRNELKQVFEFGSCLEDVLKLEYNKNIAKPIKLELRKDEYTENRRYITENGILDKRSLSEG